MQLDKQLAFGGSAAVKRRSADGVYVAGYLVRFTTREQRDLYGEYFDASTDFMLDQGYAVKGTRVLFNHGYTREIGPRVLGEVVEAELTPAGLFVEALIKEQDDYTREVLRALEEGRLGLGWSSGALPQSVLVEGDGHIARWAIIEASLTHTPAMPFVTQAHLRTWRAHEVRDQLCAFGVQCSETRGASEGSTTANITVTEAQSASQNRSTRMDIDRILELLREIAALLDVEMTEDEEQTIAEDAQEFVEAAEDTLLEDVVPADEDEDEEEDEEDERARMLSDEEREQLVKRYLEKRVKARRAQPRRPSPALAPSRARFTAAPATGRYSHVNLQPRKATPLLDLVTLATKSAAGSAVKAQNPAIGSLGGFLVGQQLADEILPELRAGVVAFQAGVRQTQIDGVGQYVIPKLTASPTAYRPGINQPVSSEAAQFDTIVANMRPIAAQIVIPRQMLATQAVAAEEFLRSELIKSLRLQIDKEIFVGTGSVVAPNTGAEILGIRQVVAAAAPQNLKELGTGNGAFPTLADLDDAITALYAANVESSDTWAWVFHPRVEGVIRKLADTTGQPLLRPNYGDPGYERLLGFPKLMTTQIPVNLVTGTDTTTSLIFLGRFDYAQYIMSNQIEIMVDEYSLANSLQVRVVAYTFSDFVVHYPEAFYVMTGVNY
jgi:HK97 family phage major capsid protein